MKERHYFTKSSTFDIDYLLGVQKENQSGKQTSNGKFDNKAIFDVKNLLEK
ncbi:MAG: hypothetical protein VB119_08330 [Candidatus Metalachnospira sp.]|nr:hypothetical protein [Candidatus Metalachnospira sp.]